MKLDIIDREYHIQAITEPFSICMTVKNESDTIERFLSSLLNAQSVLPDEVVIVDGGSTDDTCYKIKKFDNKKIHLIEVPGVSPAAGRNIAAREAINELQVTLDAGTFLDENLLLNLVGMMHESFGDKPDMVSGSYHPIEKNSKWGQYFIPEWYNDVHIKASFLPSCRCACFYRSTFKKAGGFPEYLKQRWGEDTLFMLNVKKFSKCWVLNRRARVYWHVPMTLEEAKILAHNYGMGNGEISYGEKPPVTKDPIMTAVLEGYEKGQQLRGERI